MRSKSSRMERQLRFAELAPTWTVTRLACGGEQLDRTVHCRHSDRGGQSAHHGLGTRKLPILVSQRRPHCVHERSEWVIRHLHHSARCHEHSAAHPFGGNHAHNASAAIDNQAGTSRKSPLGSLMGYRQGNAPGDNPTGNHSPLQRPEVRQQRFLLVGSERTIAVDAIGADDAEWRGPRQHDPVDECEKGPILLKHVLERLRAVVDEIRRSPLMPRRFGTSNF